MGRINTHMKKEFIFSLKNSVIIYGWIMLVPFVLSSCAGKSSVDDLTSFGYLEGVTSSSIVFENGQLKENLNFSVVLGDSEEKPSPWKLLLSTNEKGYLKKAVEQHGKTLNTLEIIKEDKPKDKPYHRITLKNHDGWEYLLGIGIEKGEPVFIVVYPINTSSASMSFDIKLSR